jgi:hypothetical protein
MNLQVTYMFYSSSPLNRPLASEEFYWMELGMQKEAVDEY